MRSGREGRVRGGGGSRRGEEYVPERPDDKLLVLSPVQMMVTPAACVRAVVIK